MKTIHIEMFKSNIIAQKLVSCHINKQNFKKVVNFNEGFHYEGDTR
jgi:hypothetical protein